jgi:hypothetical protein
MPRVVIALAIIVAVVAAVSGQTRTADGVAALARGDYQRAVEILKPIAEDSWSDDSAAQFFMAGLYENGHGVPADPLRACALYARAASKYESPFGRQASPLFAALIGRGQEFNDECQLLANVGFDTGFEPATFDLGPRHYVEWTLSAATVTDDGETKRHPMPLAMRGARFLPLQHTELSTGPDRSLSRHFIEVFLWYPKGRTGPWNLQWHLFEIVGAEIIRIDTPEPLLTMSGDAPPSRDEFNVREYAVVRVDSEGNTEWAVLKGPHSSTQRIETDAERRETRETAAAHDAALKQVDWTKRSDVNRPPSLTYVDAEGCGYFQLVGLTPQRDEVIVVRADAQALAVPTGGATFDLSRASSNITIEVYVYDKPQRHLNFCTDVIMHEENAIDPQVWRATAGAVSVVLSTPGTRSGPRATVTLTDVVFRNSAGTIVKVSSAIRLSAVVGAVFG